jgi:hypothetical protein
MDFEIIERLLVQFLLRIGELLFGRWLARGESLTKEEHEAAIAKVRAEENEKCMQGMQRLLLAAVIVLVYIWFKSAAQSAARA